MGSHLRACGQKNRLNHWPSLGNVLYSSSSRLNGKTSYQIDQYVRAELGATLDSLDDHHFSTSKTKKKDKKFFT